MDTQHTIGDELRDIAYQVSRMHDNLTLKGVEVDRERNNRAVAVVQTPIGVNTLARWFEKAGAKGVSIVTNGVDNTAAVQYGIKATFKFICTTAEQETVYFQDDDLDKCLNAMSQLFESLKGAKRTQLVPHERNGKLMEFAVITPAGQSAFYRVVEVVE